LSPNWHVQRVAGDDLKGIEKAIVNAKREKNKPSIILVRTHIGFGSPHKHDTADVHGSPLGEEELRLTKENLGWPDKKFYIPKEALDHMRKAVTNGKKAETAWDTLFSRYRKKYPVLAEKWHAFSESKLPEEWEALLPVFNPADGSVATRSASGKVLNAIADALPNLLGGSADLAPSNNTHLKKYPDFGNAKGGRNIHFGVREHAMGAALNGMALSRMLIPYGGTFLIFSDYMRPAIRVSALMGAHVIYVFTHDSVGLGEDGPTHQPIEHLTSLRAMPRLNVIRPADANETAGAWKVALKTQAGPTR
jgi:transketolase